MIIRQLGQQDYLSTWEQMRQFTLDRTRQTQDECWLLEHPAVYTQGQAGKAEHIINPGHIPIIQTDRGGQVTYHGPGQLVAYILIDLNRRNLGIRTLVLQLEQLLISLLATYNITALTREKAPGVYVLDKKIASIGLRVKNGCTYHGIALNVDMDLTPFAGINPCGFAKLQMTQMRDYVPNVDFAEVNTKLAELFSRHFKN
ncbi:lipoyl(octanoyl) transferase [Legionella beliardensis]|uniref:Octanoyltransferase n=1 Tax=Legionella beliardensis TaxID=91822 RepID=A0A378I322_9GAMM|nr:lipoyl(octanoyl) transferase LipB [Legionella beliardensis]STX29091.1 lipoyl(octanoyl) transferase [Legionella beliardensis]